MRTPKSANGPRSNSFRPDSPSTTNFPRGRKTQPSPSPHRTWSVPDASSKPQLNLHLRLETISGRSGPGPVCKNLRLSLPSPAITWTGEVGGINCGGDMGVRRCLARSLTSLAFRCALQRVQTVPAAIHSGRIPPSRQPPTGDGRLRKTPPRHTGPGPFRTRPPSSITHQSIVTLHIVYSPYPVTAR